jgi:hypothetical protein
MSTEVDVRAAERAGEQAGQSVEQTWHREAQDFGLIDVRPYSEHVRFPPP